jgi:hypothetical protein
MEALMKKAILVCLLFLTSCVPTLLQPYTLAFSPETKFLKPTNRGSLDIFVDIFDPPKLDPASFSYEAPTGVSLTFESGSLDNTRVTAYITTDETLAFDSYPITVIGKANFFDVSGVFTLIYEP